MSNSYKSGVAHLVVAGTLWGTGGLTGTLLARATGLGPLGIATWRLGGGGLLLVALLFATRRRPFPTTRPAWTRIVALAALAALFQASYFGAVARLGVGLATLLTIGLSPILVLLTEALTGRRRITPANVTTAALALTGLGLLVGAPQGGRPLTALLAGSSFALLAAAGFATLTLLQSRPVTGLDELSATGWSFTLGAAFLTPLAGHLTFTPAATPLTLALALAIGPTAIAYAAYFRGLRTAPAGTAALMALLEPLVGTALAAFVLGDRLTTTGLFGAGLLLIALILEPVATLRPARQPLGAVNR